MPSVSAMRISTIALVLEIAEGACWAFSNIQLCNLFQESTRVTLGEARLPDQPGCY